MKPACPAMFVWPRATINRGLTAAIFAARCRDHVVLRRIGQNRELLRWETPHGVMLYSLFVLFGEGADADYLAVPGTLCCLKSLAR
jgi:hypothetical protein